MRDIRFRAWLKGRMVYFTPDDDYFIDGDGRLVKIAQIENGCNYQGFEDYECNLMQFTGLKDKDCKDIFEVDIVKVEIPVVSVNEDFIGQVKMLEGRWWVDNGNDAIPLWSEINEITVLGNIYENPELMEEPS